MDIFLFISTDPVYDYISMICDRRCLQFFRFVTPYHYYTRWSHKPMINIRNSSKRSSKINTFMYLHKTWTQCIMAAFSFSWISLLTNNVTAEPLDPVKKRIGSALLSHRDTKNVNDTPLPKRCCGDLNTGEKLLSPSDSIVELGLICKLH